MRVWFVVVMRQRQPLLFLMGRRKRRKGRKRRK
jgi:hypothetical protein